MPLGTRAPPTYELPDSGGTVDGRVGQGGRAGWARGVPAAGQVGQVGRSMPKAPSYLAGLCKKPPLGRLWLLVATFWLLLAASGTPSWLLLGPLLAAPRTPETVPTVFRVLRGLDPGS